MAAASRRRRILRLALRGALVVALLCAIAGCHSTVTPPADPRDPVTVFLVVDDRHSGLLMPDEGGGFVEYGYGEWLWYAHNENAWYRAFPAMLWPTRGTLGRRRCEARSEAELRARFHWMHLTAFEVAGVAVETLRDRLRERYESRIDEEVYNAVLGLHFVPVDDGFWLCWTCADALGRWLEELGCEVSWVPIRIGVELAPYSS